MRLKSSTNLTGSSTMAGMVEGGATLVFSAADWNISEASASLSMSGLDLWQVGGER